MTFLKPPLEVRLDFEKTFRTSIDKFMEQGGLSDQPSRFSIVLFDRWMTNNSGGFYDHRCGIWNDARSTRPMSTRDVATRLFGRNADRLLTYLINNNWNTEYQ